MRRRRLIVNADDFGLTAGVNRAIAEAHRHGVVTSSTLMANGQAFQDAVYLAEKMPLLSVGCHVVLIDGEPVLQAEQLRSITAYPEGTHFRGGLKSFAVRALAGRLNPVEVEAEVIAQIRKLQSSGINVSHLDTHKHTHLFPSVLRPILQAAKACGVRALRNPFGPRRPLRSSELWKRPGLWTRYAEVQAFRALANRFRDAASRADLITPDGTFGIVVTGALNEQLFRAIAAVIPEGTWEFVCHPGYNDDDLKAAHTRLGQSREAELHLLTGPKVRELLSDEGITLISYRELVAENGNPP